ncbi:MAG: gluconate 2-dehydrogenase subunit 3 family protein [Bryobacterales bacterium]|nr:gluconate 2-dehydrogenase subunit 3 family protein [Bryobacterales bacterium]
MRSRREVLKLAAGAAGVRPAGFFTREEFRMLDELTEAMIPTDDHSPGARAAGVAAYIAGALDESNDAGLKRRWKAGLKRLSKTGLHGQENHPFFKELKERTVFAYYTSKIGIHREMEYKGNVMRKDW